MSLIRNIAVSVVLIGICPILALPATLTKQQQEIIEHIDSLNTQFDPDLLKAIAWLESHMTQFNADGATFVDGSLNRKLGRVSHDCGVFQLNEDTLKKAGLTKKQIKRCKTDANFNIDVGVSILEGKGIYIKNLQRQKKRWAKIVKKNNLKGMSDLDIQILAYNSVQKDHSYVRLIKKYKEEKPWEQLLIVQNSIKN